jgi:large subunit ribosomal protein L24
MSGHVALAGENVTFKGPIQIEATDPKTFVTWLDGRSGAAPIFAGPLKAGGTMTIGAQEIAVDRLKVEVDRKTIEGRLGYAWASAGRPPRLDADLKAAELDVDALLGFTRNALAGSGFEWPGEIALALEVNRATVAGYEAKGVSARLKLDRNGLAIDRARVADLGQASFDLNGRIDGPLATPRGSLTLDIDGRNLDAAVEVLAKFAPDLGERVRKTASRIVPVRVRTTLQIEEAQAGAAGPSAAKLALTGTAKGARLRLSADATGDAATRTVPALRLDGEIAHDDGSVLVALLGLDQTVAVERKPGSFKFAARGPTSGDMTVDARLAAGGLDAVANGTMRLGDAVTAKLDATWRAADVSPLARGYAPATVGPLPVGLRMRVAATATDVSFDELSGTVADTPLRGRLKLSRDGSTLDGQLDLDTLDGSALVGVLEGAPRPGARRETWSQEPFGDGMFGRLQGRLGFRIGKSALWPLTSVRQLSGTLRLAPSEIVLEDLKGAVDEGRLTGELTLQRRDGLDVRGRVELADVDAATLLPEGGRAAVTGRVSLQVQAEANGLSPAALVGSLRGSGTFTAVDSELAGLNPKAFESVTQAVDKGLTIDSARLRDVVTTLLDGGRLSVPRIEAAFTINGGYVRVGNSVVKGRGADLMMSGNANLNDGSVEARFVLSGAQSTESAVRPDVFVNLKGPVQAPKRTIDVAALSGWLMLRSIERQAKQLEAIEAERRGEGTGAVPPAQAAAPSPAATDAGPETREKPRPVIRAPRAAPTAPSAAVPAPTMPLGTERAPALPPPLEIGPAPGRRSRANGGELPQSAGPRPPGFVPPAAYSRPLPLDPLVNPHR